MNIRPISKELQEKAIKELNEDPARVQDDINYIKTWLSQQKYINARKDDQLLLTFLRGCKFSLERTKEKLDTFYTVRTVSPELFTNRDPLLPEIQEVLKMGVVLPLKQLTPSGTTVTLIRNRPYDLNKISHESHFKATMMVMDILMLENDDYIISGNETVQDMSELTLTWLMSFPTSLIKKAMHLFQNVYPVRNKGGHFINASGIFDAIYKVMEVFLNEKMKGRIKVYSADKMDELYKTVPKSILPVEYGGEGGTIEELTAFWKAKVESYRQWFLDDEQYRTDEKKRPGKPKTSDTIFGIDGSFRKLDVD